MVEGNGRTAQREEELCIRCGHDVDKHRHLRRGSDCSLCDCPKLQRAALPARILRWLTDRSGNA